MTQAVEAAGPDQAVRPVPWRATSAIIAGLVLVRTLISADGYLVGDDFAVRYRAAVQPWSFGYAFEPYNGHISPIGYSAQWLLQWAFPGSHLALVLATSVLMTATLALTAATMWALTGRAAAMGLVSVIVGLGLFTFEVGTWWCVSLYSMTYMAFAALALFGLVRLLRFGRSGSLALVGLVGAVLSDSKGFLVAVLLFGVAAGIAIQPLGRLGVRAAWKRSPRLWWAAVALTCASLAVAAVLAPPTREGGFRVGPAVRMMWDLWTVNVAPAVFGGPWWWWFHVPTESWPPTRTLPSTPALVGVLCLAGCIAGLIWVVLRRTSISGFVPWAVGYALATTGIPVLARAGTDVASPAYRYTFDVVLPVALILTLAAVPLWWESGRVSRWLGPMTGVLVLSMTLSTVQPASAWTSNEGQAYVQRAVAGFNRIPAGQQVIPQGVPTDLVPPLLWQYATTEAVLRPQPGAPEFAGYADEHLFGFAEDGSVEEQGVNGPQGLPGPDPDCGYRVDAQPRLIPLDGPLIQWGFMARVAYFTDSDTRLHLAVGGQVHTVPLTPGGLRAVYFPVTGPGSEVLVSADAGAVVCVTDLLIGNRVHPGTQQNVALPPAPVN